MTNKRDVPERVIAGIEALAKRLRAEVRRVTRESGLTRNLELARLRKEAALIAELIEQYVHQLRLYFMRATSAPRSRPRRKRAA